MSHWPEAAALAMRLKARPSLSVIWGRFRIATLGLSSLGKNRLDPIRSSLGAVSSFFFRVSRFIFGSTFQIEVRVGRMESSFFWPDPTLSCCGSGDETKTHSINRGHKTPNTVGVFIQFHLGTNDDLEVASRDLAKPIRGPTAMTWPRRGVMGEFVSRNLSEGV